MTAGRLIFLLALRFMCVTSDDESDTESSCDDSGLCETHTLSAPLGSSVLLPCSFSTRSQNLVSWVHVREMVQLISKGRVKFLDPRNGRLKAFPNHGSEGNYSICIDELEKSDLGCYRCEQGVDCLQVELVAGIGGVSEETLLLVSLCAGAAFIVLIVGGYFCMKYIWGCINRAPDHANNPVCAGAIVLLQVPVLHLRKWAENNREEKTTSSMKMTTKAQRSSRATLPEMSATCREFSLTRTGLNPLRVGFIQTWTSFTLRGWKATEENRGFIENSSADYGKQASVVIIMLTKVTSASSKPRQPRRGISAEETPGKRRSKKIKNTKTRFTTGAQSSSTTGREPRTRFRELLRCFQHPSGHK